MIEGYKKALHRRLRRMAREESQVHLPGKVPLPEREVIRVHLKPQVLGRRISILVKSPGSRIWV